MERKDVLIPEAELARQREFEKKIREMFAAREAHPVACVDTFGCQQNVADGQKLMGMLEKCGFTFLRSYCSEKHGKDVYEYYLLPKEE